MIAVTIPLLALRPGAYFDQCSTWAPDFVEAIRRHYTGSRGAPPGKKMAWRIFEAGQLLGWIDIGEPAFKLAARRRLGLADGRPLHETVCCFIYRIEVDRSERNASSSGILLAWLPEAESAWRREYGWARRIGRPW